MLFNARVEVPNLFPPNVTTGLTQSVQENAAGRTQVGFVRAFDADGDTRLTYTITSTQFSINSVTGEIIVAPGANLDFETQSRIVVPLQITDSGSPALTSNFSITINLTNANDAPTAIALSNPNVLTQVNGLELSTIQVTDQDVAAQYLFSTVDPRFEVRNGRLALRAQQHLAQNLAGTRSTVQVTVRDAADPNSSATLPLSFNITSNPFPWQNPVSRFDVNADGNVTALDALLVINALNSPTRGRGPLNVPRDFTQLTQHYLDTSGDNQLTALDALQVINQLNTRRSSAAGEGESAVRSSTASTTSTSAATRPRVDHAAWYDAFTSIERERRRRT